MDIFYYCDECQLLIQDINSYIFRFCICDKHEWLIVQCNFRQKDIQILFPFMEEYIEICTAE